MGSFYGSVQVRTADRVRVRLAVEEIASPKQRFLLGPSINGWVGVYPEGWGQDFGVASDLARRLGGELIASLVHDDDVFCYRYYCDGECADQYDTDPDYWNEVSEEERRQLTGRPETFAHLVADWGRFADVAKRIADQSAAPKVLATTRLEEFAEALGIRNAVISYEDLKVDEETDGVEGWAQFLHVPDLTEEKARKAAARAAIKKAKKLFTKQGELLAERSGLKGWASPTPWLCPAPDGHGFLVGWSRHPIEREQRISLELYGPAWSDGPRATTWVIGPRLCGMELSASARFLAVTHEVGEPQAAVWDLQENRVVAGASQVGGIKSIGFLANESAMFSVGSYRKEGYVVITPLGPGEPRSIELPGAELAAAHPRGPWLVVADDRNRLVLLDVESARTIRTDYLGGKYVPTPLERQARANLQASLAATDPSVMDEQARALYELQLDRFAKMLDSKGLSLEEARRQLEENVGKMRQSYATGIDEQANRGAENAFRLRFDQNGEWLFVATETGVRVYAWRELLEAEDLRPTFAVDVPAFLVETDLGQERREGTVLDLDHDADRNRLLFAAVDGRVRFLDLTSGESGVLLEPPGLPPIERLVLSRDLATLALSCVPCMFHRSLKKRGSVLQFWSYEALSKG